jgi:hypothetical protein
MQQDLPAKVHVAIDFHMNWGFNRAMYTNGANGALWLAYMNAAMNPATVDDYGPSTESTVTDWMGSTRGADFYTTAEVGEVTPLSDAEVAAFGEGWIKSVSALLNDGEIPAATNDNTVSAFGLRVGIGL